MSHLGALVSHTNTDVTISIFFRLTSDSQSVFNSAVLSNHLCLDLLQVLVFQIALAQLQAMRTIRPKKAGKVPGVEIQYGNAAKPQKILIHLQQVKTILDLLLNMIYIFLITLYFTCIILY